MRLGGLGGHLIAVIPWFFNQACNVAIAAALPVLSEPAGKGYLPWCWVGIALAVIMGTATLMLARRRAVRAETRPPIKLDTQERQRQYAKQGLVVLVGVYRPNRGSPAEALTPQERQEFVERREYVPLDLPNSTLAPAIAAVRAHSSKLKHCWLVSTNPGSSPYVPVLVRYLEDNNVAPNCQFHHGPGYSVTFRVDDLMISQETKDLTERILDEAEREYKLRAADMVCDFTSCPRMMALGMILACLDGRRDVQFVGTTYDDEGKPTGDLLPVMYGFSPVFLGG